MIGEPTIEKGLDKALTKAGMKRTVEAATDEITSDLQEAQKLTAPPRPGAASMARGVIDLRDDLQVTG